MVGLLFELNALRYYAIPAANRLPSRPEKANVTGKASQLAGSFPPDFLHLLLQKRTGVYATFWRAAARIAMRPQIDAIVRFAKISVGLKSEHQKFFRNFSHSES